MNGGQRKEVCGREEPQTRGANVNLFQYWYHFCLTLSIAVESTNPWVVCHLSIKLPCLYLVLCEFLTEQSKLFSVLKTIKNYIKPS